MLQALFKEDQAAYTTISVLEGMDAFKGYMESYNDLKCLSGQLVVENNSILSGLAAIL